MAKYYGYTCVTSVKYNREDKEARKNTKQYQMLISKCKEQHIELEEIYSDLLSDFYRSREELIKLCKLVQYEDVIVIDSIFALGTTLDDINDNIMLVNGSCLLKILTPFEGLDLSTVDEPDADLGVFNDKLNQFAKLLGGKDAPTLLPYAYYKHYWGRPQIPLTEDFIKIYWYYENFFIDEKTALDNPLIKMAKASFHAKCRLYELTNEYKADLAKQNSLFQTADKPKRSGKVPEWFTTDFMEQVDNNPDAIGEICIEHNIFPISLLEYNRWKVKYTIKRKGLSETSKKFLDSTLTESLQKIVSSTNQII